jgi:hypothetical protein
MTPDEEVEDTLSLIMQRIATDRGLVLQGGTLLLGVCRDIEEELLPAMQDEEEQVLELEVLNSALKMAEGHFTVCALRPIIFFVY